MRIAWRAITAVATAITTAAAATSAVAAAAAVCTVMRSAEWPGVRPAVCAAARRLERMSRRRGRNVNVRDEAVGASRREATRQRRRILWPQTRQARLAMHGWQNSRAVPTHARCALIAALTKPARTVRVVNISVLGDVEPREVGGRNARRQTYGRGRARRRRRRDAGLEQAERRQHRRRVHLRQLARPNMNIVRTKARLTLGNQRRTE
eukprot:4123848-Pleurochrysis_carterae.AAC.1